MSLAFGTYKPNVEDLEVCVTKLVNERELNRIEKEAARTDAEDWQEKCSQLLRTNEQLKARLAMTLDCLRRLCDRPGKKGKRTMLQKLRQAGDSGLDHEDYFLALDIEKVLK